MTQRILNELAAAKVCLLNLEKKADYDQRLRATLPVPPVKPPPVVRAPRCWRSARCASVKKALYGNVWDYCAEPGSFRGYNYGSPALEMTVRVGPTNDINYRFNDVGFRVARTPDANEQLAPGKKGRAAARQPQAKAAPLPPESFGLKTEVFRGIDFNQLVKTRIDPQIDWLWGPSTPDPALPADGFSVR
ncbi:MAG TPA: hypothetical protein PK867_26515 [Pirellulales bacterium]|nr:hypothetical protein [Pirellulales bacterium]